MTTAYDEVATVYLDAYSNPSPYDNQNTQKCHSISILAYEEYYQVIDNQTKEVIYFEQHYTCMDDPTYDLLIYLEELSKQYRIVITMTKDFENCIVDFINENSDFEENDMDYDVSVNCPTIYNYFLAQVL